jgi:hypothetical protein
MTMIDGRNDDDFADEVVEQELELADDEESLPWLDSDYEEDEEGGYDTGRLIGIAMLGLLVIGLGAVGFWLYNNRGPDPELVADGSTIEAPAGPIKERPNDAGGKQFEGTGNVAPAVGEGETREGRLADDTAPKPSIDAAVSSTGKPAARTTQAATTGGVGVQVGAFSSRESAEAGWATLIRKSDKLSGVSHRVEQAQVDGSTVYRLQAVGGDLASARALCNSLKAEGIACQVKP